MPKIALLARAFLLAAFALQSGSALAESPTDRIVAYLSEVTGNTNPEWLAEMRRRWRLAEEVHVARAREIIGFLAQRIDYDTAVARVPLRFVSHYYLQIRPFVRFADYILGERETTQRLRLGHILRRQGSFGFQLYQLVRQVPNAESADFHRLLSRTGRQMRDQGTLTDAEVLALLRSVLPDFQRPAQFPPPPGEPSSSSVPSGILYPAQVPGVQDDLRDELTRPDDARVEDAVEALLEIPPAELTVETGRALQALRGSLRLSDDMRERLTRRLDAPCAEWTAIPPAS